MSQCVVTGCHRKNRRETDGVWICSVHWRLSARTPERKVYNRLWRLSKKYGRWTMALDRRFWRVWGAIVRRTEAKARGDINQREIDHLFGWGEATHAG